MACSTAGNGVGNSYGDVETLFDGDKTTSIAFHVPEHGSDALLLFECALAAPVAVSEIRMTFGADKEFDAGKLMALQKSVSFGAVDTDGTEVMMETRNGEADYPIEEGTLSNTGGSSVSYTGGYVSNARAGNEGPVNEGDQYGTVVEAGDSTDPATPRAAAVRVYFTPSGVEELRLVTLSVYPTVDPGVLTGETEPVRLVDVHFHPCSFNHDCASMAMLLLEQERASVGAQWVFGLQHNMAPNAAPWRRAAFEVSPAEHSMGGELPDYDVADMQMQTPFHYADPMCQADRLTLNTPIAYPGVVQVNSVRARSEQYTITSYDAWPVVPNSKADWRLLNDWFYNTDPAGQERIKLFVGPVRLSLGWEYYEDTFGVCESNPATVRSWNLEAMLAYDKLFPGAVHGVSELNLNKRVLFPNQRFAPVISDEWLACFAESAEYMAMTGKVLMFHNDFNIDQEGQKGLDKILMIGEKFPNTTILWCHTGLAPEAKPGVFGDFHIEHGLKKFLATGPKGKRFVDLSWPSGFFRALNPEVEPDRDDAMAARWGAYVNFINDFSEYITVGSDQVSLFYAANIGRDLEGTKFQNHKSYLQGQTWPGVWRQELGLMKHASEFSGIPFRSESIANIAHRTADAIMARVVPPPDDVLPSEAEAMSIIWQLFDMQHADMKSRSSVDAAPSREEWIPNEFSMARLSFPHARARETARLASCETCASFRPLRPCLNVVVRQQPAEQSVCHAWRRERACDRTRRRVGYTHNSWIARRRAYAHRRGPRHGQGSVPQAPARAAVFQSVRQRPLPEDRHLGAHHDGRGQPRQHQCIEDEGKWRARRPGIVPAAAVTIGSVRDTYYFFCFVMYHSYEGDFTAGRHGIRPARAGEFH